MENKRERERLKSERQQQEDLAFTKVVFWFLGAVVLMLLLWLADNYFVNGVAGVLGLAGGIDILLKVLTVAGPVAAIICGMRAAKAVRGKLALWAGAVFAVGLAMCSTAVWLWYSSGVALMNVLVPAATVLALIYYLYQREFFFVSLVCGGGLLGLWLFFRQGMADVRLYVFLVLLGIFLVAVAVLTRVLQTKEGVLTIKGKRFELLNAGANYALIYITCALIALVIIAAVLLGGVGSTMTYYALPVAWLLVMAVYYTVKLM